MNGQGNPTYAELAEYFREPFNAQWRHDNGWPDGAPYEFLLEEAMRDGYFFTEWLLARRGQATRG